MFKINNDQILNYEDDLKKFRFKAFPFATKATINGAAFKARGFAQENIRNDMIQRNRFTVSSVRVEQAKTLNIRRQAAIVGSIADYMEDQEFGVTKTRKGKEGIPIATSYAAGQAQNAQPRTRLPRKPNKMASIQLNKRRKKGSNRKQQNIAAIRLAAQSGNKYVFLDLGRTRGIFRVLGGKRKPRIKMVWSMSRRSVVIPKNPWLAPAIKRTEPEIPQLYANALRFQLKRHNLFRNR